MRCGRELMAKHACVGHALRTAPGPARLQSGPIKPQMLLRGSPRVTHQSLPLAMCPPNIYGHASLLYWRVSCHVEMQLSLESWACFSALVPECHTPRLGRSPLAPAAVTTQLFQPTRVSSGPPRGSATMAAVSAAPVIRADLSEAHPRPSGAATEGEAHEVETDRHGMPIHPGELSGRAVRHASRHRSPCAGTRAAASGVLSARCRRPLPRRQDAGRTSGRAQGCAQGLPP